MVFLFFFLLLVSVVQVLVWRQNEGVGLVYCIMKRALRVNARMNITMTVVQWQGMCVIGLYVTRERCWGCFSPQISILCF